MARHRRIIIPFEKFNLLLDIPASYDIDKIEQRIIFPSIKLLKKIIISKI